MTESTTIQAPMPGVFYRRSDPDDPPFAEPGDRVEAGETIALIGVMKNFNDKSPSPDPAGNSRV
jgi:acetyl-CoA carboxylase biotin carboxyl carrier protein